MDKKRILIIDDEQDFCKLVKKNLERGDKFFVDMATNGIDGVELAKKMKPDLILLDVIMPHMDGPDVALSLESDRSSKDIPIIFLTATVTEEETTSRGGVIGRHPFIAKTTNIEQLITQIEQHIKIENNSSNILF